VATPDDREQIHITQNAESIVVFVSRGINVRCSGAF
jgi:hypothetical protein